VAFPVFYHYKTKLHLNFRELRRREIMVQCYVYVEVRLTTQV